MRVLRVATYNLRDFKDDPAAAAEIVRRLAPDILCLQEVPRRFNTAWPVSGFARAAGMLWSGAHRGSGGTTVLTSLRTAVRAVGHHRLPVPVPQRRRGYAVASVDSPAPLVVVSVHLPLSARERLDHAQRVVADTGARDGALILAGDLNEGPGEGVDTWLTRRLHRLDDAAPSYPSRSPAAALDAIYGSVEVERVDSDPVDVPEALLERASDHRPVWVDVRLRPP